MLLEIRMSINGVGCCYGNIYDYCDDAGRTGPTGPAGPAGPAGVGLPNQVYVTDATGTTAIWSDDLNLPDDLSVGGSSTFTGNGLFQQDLQVQNDLNVTNGDFTVATGDLNVLLGNTLLRNTEIDGALTLDHDLILGASSGNPGDIIVKLTGTQQWQAPSFPESVITGGSSRQLLVKDPTGASTIWTSNPTIPGNLIVTGNTTVGVLSAGGTFTSTTLSNLQGNLQFNSSSGNTNDILQKTGASTQAWVAPSFSPTVLTPGSNNWPLFTRSGAVAFSPIVPSDVSTGTANQFLVKNTGGTTTIFTSNPRVPGNLIVDGTSTLTGAVTASSTLSVAGTSTLTGAVAAGSTLSVAGTSTLTGAVTAGNNLSVAGTSTLTGAVSAGNNLTVAGTNTLNGPVTVNGNINITSNLSFNAGAGITGHVLVKDNTLTQSWQFPQYVAEYYQNSPLQDMNGAATVLLMTSASPNVTTSSITYSAGVFTFANNGIYLCNFITRPSTSNAQTQVNFRINGSYQGSTINTYIPGVTSASQLTLQRVYKLNAGSTLEVVSEPLVAGVINTSGADSRSIACTLITFTRLGGF